MGGSKSQLRLFGDGVPSEAGQSQVVLSTFGLELRQAREILGAPED